MNGPKSLVIALMLLAAAAHGQERPRVPGRANQTIAENIRESVNELRRKLSDEDKRLIAYCQTAWSRNAADHIIPLPEGCGSNDAIDLRDWNSNILACEREANHPTANAPAMMARCAEWASAPEDDDDAEMPAPDRSPVRKN